MNLATPVILCESNDEFRFFVREMLMKHGFFHIMEASNPNEATNLILSQKKASFVIIQNELLNESIIDSFVLSQKFIILGQSNQTQTTMLASRLGVKHFLNFPFSSQMLIKKMETIF
ncbi:MAG: hypothetical protein AB7I27_02745 [Bacteriovoracaceae bacterium]